MMEIKDYATIGIAALGFFQGGFIFLKGRRDKQQADLHKAETIRVEGISTKLEEHIKEDREMHERLQRSETRLENQQQQLNDANARHGDLVKKLDDIQRLMLTKEDFKLLVDVIRNPGN